MPGVAFSLALVHGGSVVGSGEQSCFRWAQQGSLVHTWASGKRVLSCGLPDTLWSTARKRVSHLFFLSLLLHSAQLLHPGVSFTSL